MPVPTVSFDPAEASLRVDLSPTFGISVSFPKGNKSEPTFSVHTAGRSNTRPTTSPEANFASS